MDEIGAALSKLFVLPEGQIPFIGMDIAIPVFSKEILDDLCSKTKEFLEGQPRVLYVQSPVVVVGDLHGNLHDLLRIFAKFGTPERTKYVFLGDYVDRGNYATEIVTILFYFYTQYPNNITILRGNHEFSDLNDKYGFRSEVLSIYHDDEIWIKINEVFNYLPIAAVIDEEKFCVHGGIARGLDSLKKIEIAEIPLTPENVPNLIKSLLWSDPCKQTQIFDDNQRGFGQSFGLVAMMDFYKATGMKMIIRAHQCVSKGIAVFNKTCITVFSSSGYQNQNKGAVLIFNKGQTEIEKYMPINFPQREQARFIQIKKKSPHAYCYNKIPGLMQPGNIRLNNIRSNKRIIKLSNSTLILRSNFITKPKSFSPVFGAVYE